MRGNAPRRGPSSIGTQLYATPSSTGQADSYRPRVWLSGNIESQLNGYQWQEILGYARQLFAQNGTLGAAILQKATYAVGDSWKPQFIADENDLVAGEKWGAQAEEWLVNNFFPVCDVRGPQFDFTRNLTLDCVALDVDGERAMVLTKTESGFPQLAFYPAHRIGSRGYETEIKEGAYNGAKITNGVITGRDGRILAYRFLGDKKEDDMDIPAKDVQHLFEPEWDFQKRGITKFARCILAAFDHEDVMAFLKRGVKLDASVGLIKHTEEGQPEGPGESVIGGDDSSTDDVINTSSGNPIEKIDGGEIWYARAGRNEKIESLVGQRPHPNVAAFLEKLERECLLSVGWFYEMIDPSKIGGASVRLIQDEVCATIRERQKTLEKRARRAVIYALAVAMNSGLLPRYKGRWWKWGFERPALPTVDQGYSRAADVEDYKLGISTLAEICGKHGKWYEDVRRQTLKETREHLRDAKILAAEFGISIGAASQMLRQSSPNPAPITPDAPQTNGGNSQ